MATILTRWCIFFSASTTCEQQYPGLPSDLKAICQKCIVSFNENLEAKPKSGPIYWILTMWRHDFQFAKKPKLEYRMFKSLQNWWILIFMPNFRLHFLICIQTNYPSLVNCLYITWETRGLLRASRAHRKKIYVILAVWPWFCFLIFLIMKKVKFSC